MARKNKSEWKKKGKKEEKSNLASELPLLLQQALRLQLVDLHFKNTVLHTNTIAAKLYNLRCKFRYSNSHPQHTVENRTAEAHSTLMISSTYPGPPSMPRSVTGTLAKPKNKEKF